MALPEGVTEPIDLQSPEVYSFPPDGNTHAIYTRIFDVPWTSRLDFIKNEIYGFHFSVGTENLTNRGSLSFHPDNPNAIAVNCTVKGIKVPGKDGNDLLTWTTARITVRYETVSFPGEGGSGESNEPFVNNTNIFIDSGIEVVTFPGQRVQKLADAVGDDEFNHKGRDVKIIIPHLHIRISRTNLTSIPLSAISQLGGINGSSLNMKLGGSNSLSFEAKTVLYEGFNMGSSINIFSGQLVWNFTSNFDVMKFPGLHWNKIPTGTDDKGLTTFETPLYREILSSFGDYALRNQ